MRKIWPSQDNYIQLKDKFASCEFGTPTCEIKAYLVKWKWNTVAQSQRSPTCGSDFATCELGAQHAKMDSKLRNQLARFSQVTMQRAKLGFLCIESFSSDILCLNLHFLLVFSHSCNSLARKYSRKGKLPSYINSLVNT